MFMLDFSREVENVIVSKKDGFLSAIELQVVIFFIAEAILKYKILNSRITVLCV